MKLNNLNFNNNQSNEKFSDDKNKSVKLKRDLEKVYKKNNNENQTLDFITEDDKIYEIVKKYPHLKEVLISISNKFKKLNNPIVFNTVAKYTTVKKAAEIGGVYLKEMLYKLNEAIGKEKEYFEYEKSKINVLKESFLKNFNENSFQQKKPDWLNDNIDKFEVFDLRLYGDEPFVYVYEIAKNIELNKGFAILQRFKPLPLINYLKSMGFENYIEELDDDLFKVYFYRKKKINDFNV